MANRARSYCASAWTSEHAGGGKTHAKTRTHDEPLPHARDPWKSDRFSPGGAEMLRIPDAASQPLLRQILPNSYFLLLPLKTANRAGHCCHRGAFHQFILPFLNPIQVNGSLFASLPSRPQCP